VNFKNKARLFVSKDLEVRGSEGYNVNYTASTFIFMYHKSLVDTGLSVFISFSLFRKTDLNLSLSFVSSKLGIEYRDLKLTGKSSLEFDFNSSWLL